MQNQTFPKSLQAGRGLAFQTDKKLLCLNSTIPFWEIIRGPLILVLMWRGTDTFVPKKNPPENNDETFLHLFLSCPPVTACKPVYQKWVFWHLRTKQNCGYWGCLRTAFFILFFGCYQFQFWIVSPRRLSLQCWAVGPKAVDALCTELTRLLETSLSFSSSGA